LALFARQDLLSFPARRSSDLVADLLLRCPQAGNGAVRMRTVDEDMSQRHAGNTDDGDTPHLLLGYPADVHAQVAVEHPDIEVARSEEHTSELQSRENLVCRLL